MGVDKKRTIKISKITPQEKVIMENKSAKVMPDKPGQVGWTAERFKRYITQPLFDEYESFYQYINRLAGETLTELETLDGTASEKVDIESGIANNLTINGGQLNDVNVKTPTMPQQVANKQYVDDLKGKINQFRTTDITPSEDEWAYQDYAFVKIPKETDVESEAHTSNESIYKIVENIGNNETRTINVQTSANAVVESEEKVFVEKKEKEKLKGLEPIDELSLLKLLNNAFSN